MLDQFVPRHIPALLLATTITIGGAMPFWAGPEKSLEAFGFPSRISTAKAAHPLIITQSARISALGAAIWVLYLRGHFEAVDIVIASFGYVGIVDSYTCYKEGVPKAALNRGLSTGLIALWGLFGMTNGGWN
jgi:hypothetical protein